MRSRAHDVPVPGRRRWSALRSVAGAGLLSVVALVVAVVGTSGASCAAPPGPGRATHYVLKSGGGNCSYPAPPPDDLYVALGTAEYAAGGACGGYLNVTGPGGTVRVKVVDLCHQCPPGHIDLSETAFGRLAAPAAGATPVTYRQVTDPRVPAMSFRIKEGSSRWWLAVLAIDHGSPLTRVEAWTAGGWRVLARADYNYWLAEKGLGAGPFRLRLTDVRGHRAVVGGIRLEPGSIQRTATRMYGAAPARAKASRSFRRIPAPAWPTPVARTVPPGSADPVPARPLASSGRKSC